MVHEQKKGKNRSCQILRVAVTSVHQNRCKPLEVLFPAKAIEASRVCGWTPAAAGALSIRAASRIAAAGRATVGRQVMRRAENGGYACNSCTFETPPCLQQACEIRGAMNEMRRTGDFLSLRSRLKIKTSDQLKGVFEELQVSFTDLSKCSTEKQS